MVELYMSLVDGLWKSPEALKSLRDNGIGVELSNMDEKVDIIRDAGVRYACHATGMGLTLNLAKPDYIDFINTPEGDNFLDTIRGSNSPVVGFHNGFSAEEVYKMQKHPEIPKGGTLITDRDELLKRISNNAFLLSMAISDSGKIDVSDQKRVILESLDYTVEGSPVDWDIQSDEVKGKRNEIEEILGRYGTNASYMHITEPSFIGKVLEKTNEIIKFHTDNIENNPLLDVGFLFDVAHTFISSASKRTNGSVEIPSEIYFDSVLHNVRGGTYQIHLNVPSRNFDGNFSDGHQMFNLKKGVDPLGDEILDLTSRVVRGSPNLKVVTFEMSHWNVGDPVKYVENILRQAEYVAKELNLEVN